MFAQSYISIHKDPVFIRLRQLFKSRKALPAGATRAEKGRYGEDQAVRQLKRTGHRILVRNWRAGKDEIDIVCQKEDALIFVEVRTRNASALVGGYHSVTRHKKKALRRACKAYVRSLKARPSQIRFDIIEISLCQNGNFSLNHHQNIPLLDKL